MIQRQAGARAFKEYEAPARALKFATANSGSATPKPDLEGAFQAAAKGRVKALITVTTSRALSSPKTDCGSSRKAPTAFNVRGEVLCRGGRPYVVFDRRP